MVKSCAHLKTPPSGKPAEKQSKEKERSKAGKDKISFKRKLFSAENIYIIRQLVCIFLHKKNSVVENINSKVNAVS